MRFVGHQTPVFLRSFVKTYCNKTPVFSHILGLFKCFFGIPLLSHNTVVCQSKESNPNPKAHPDATPNHSHFDEDVWFWRTYAGDRI